jgi:serine/threonine protein phosphatase 1
MEADDGMNGDLTCAIGDIHGCRAMLDVLLDRCLRFAAGRPVRFVFLGDYIDRGPDSRGVVDRLLALAQRNAGEVICLRGNHEAIMLDALASGDHGLWFVNGGRDTLASYGVRSVNALPAEHLRWFAALPASFDDGRRFFVHAGVNPDRPLDAQTDEDLVWIREPFLSRRRDYGRLIVHGHTPQRSGRPDIRPWRINLDTGAVYGGRLTAAFFDDERREPIAMLNDLS